jgi:epoxyqueuosine reductase
MDLQGAAPTSAIKRKALELGFSKIGIVRADELSEESIRLSDWLAHGYHGTMTWMQKKRDDPRTILPNAKSVIVVAMNYYTPAQHSSSPSVGKISRYAWGDDYHDVLSTRLNNLLDFVTQLESGVEGRVYVDTGPIMEKAWAQRGGIGWIGKHTNVITPELGSWVFLGEIITTIELAYDSPATDHCGSCTLCIEACPTQAIVEPYVLDSNRCISYLTIEHHGEIARELGLRFDRWVYGCDVCQDVCPWNEKFAQPSSIEHFQPRRENIAPSLEELQQMTPAEFSSRFHGSPIKRTKHAGLTRNAAIASIKV